MINTADILRTTKRDRQIHRQHLAKMPKSENNVSLMFILVHTLNNSIFPWIQSMKEDTLLNTLGILVG